MIEIIIDDFQMPELDKRRFQKNYKDLNGKKWDVTDTHQNKIIYTGKFEKASLICHNLNKKHYSQIKTNTKNKHTSCKQKIKIQKQSIHKGNGF